MIKAFAGSADNPIILLGLSAKNIELLKEKKPILVNMEDLGTKGKIYICYGDTEAEIAEEMGLTEMTRKPQ